MSRAQFAPVGGHACHSLVRRLTEPAGVTEAMRDVRAAAPRLITTDTVWDLVTGDHGSGRAATLRREVERRRPLHADATIRAVRLWHTDCAEIVLVARRESVPTCCLLAIADVLATGAPRRTALEAWRAHLAADSHPRLPTGVGSPRPDLGLVEAGLHGSMIEEDLPPVQPDVASLVVAAGTALASVTRLDRLFVAVSDLTGDEHAQWEVATEGSAVHARQMGDGGQPSAAAIILTDAAVGEYLPNLAPSHPLTIAVHRRPLEGSAAVRCWVDCGALAPAAAQTLLRQLGTVLRSACGTPEPRHGSHARDQTAAILLAGDGGAVAVGPASCLPDAYADVARRRPDAVAVTDGTTTLTYRRLDDLASAAARALVSRGVAPGDRVAICMERATGLVVAILAILKAGAAYVPLDPHHPPARRAYTTQDAGVRFLVTDGKVFLGDTDAVEVTLAELTSDTDAGPDRPLPPADPDRPAYLIYTSGTTGRPKGVAIAHRSVLALIESVRHGFALGCGDVWTMFHSFAFDFSVWEIWGCLLTGGRLVVVPHWTSRSPEDFAELLRRERVTVLNQTPSAFSRLVSVLLARPDRVPLRLVIFGGETLHTRTLSNWIRRYPVADTRLVNMFGITETTVHVTWGEVTARDVLTGSRSVGRAIPGWSVSVRDPDGRVLPFGVPGEICVAGVGLALGYHGRDDLTAERFVGDPATGDRYYRSGDLGRLNPDGMLEHLGRIDDQVKIRGHRIELGEIRTILLEDQAVDDAAVTLDQVPADQGYAEPAIHAWVVLARPVSAAELRRRLGRRLPDYMVPALLTVATSIPLTGNGKVDRTRLPEFAVPEAAGSPTVAQLATPRDPGQVVLSVWQELFGEAIDPAESFFDLGGNSLLALRMGTLLRQRGLRMISPREVYLNPTIGELAALLAEPT